MVRRHVHDIPTVTPTVTEHRLHRRRCGCGQVRCALAPDGVTARPATGGTLTCYRLHCFRGRAAVTEFAILPTYAGTVVHDAMSVYDAYPTVTHALRGAHLARELVAAGAVRPRPDCAVHQ